MIKISEITPKNVWAYFQGNFRMYLKRIAPGLYYYYVRPHVIEQIEARIKSMDRECYENGECKICGCKTLNLQYADKACAGDCYPKMLNKKEWEYLKKTFGGEIEKNGIKWRYSRKYKKFYKTIKK